MAEQYTRKPNTKCSQCGKKIYKRPGILKMNKGNAYCGQDCYGKSCRNEHPCVICNKPILASAHKKTCSRACANKNRRGISYNTGRPYDKVVYQKAIKIRLMAVRGEVCERCSYDKKEILQLHHVDRNRKNNLPKNLKILCPNCHAEEHYLEKNK